MIVAAVLAVTRKKEVSQCNLRLSLRHQADRVGDMALTLTSLRSVTTSSCKEATLSLLV